MMTETKTMLNGRRLLLVEDEYFIAEDMAWQLVAGGAEVVGPVASVDAAIELIEQNQRIDGAILDVNLHGVMSWPVADSLLRHGVPFVFATGYDRATIPYHSATLKLSAAASPAVRTRLAGHCSADLSQAAAPRREAPLIISHNVRCC